MHIDLNGNIKVVGQTYVTRIPAKGWWILSPSVANETEEPWRHGRGLAVRLSPRSALSVGRWWPTSDERPGYLEDEEPLTIDPTTEEIKAWDEWHSPVRSP